MSALGGSGSAARKEEVRVGPKTNIGPHFLLKELVQCTLNSYDATELISAEVLP
jgi:hypothetical protein